MGALPICPAHLRHSLVKLEWPNILVHSRSLKVYFQRIGRFCLSSNLLLIWSDFLCQRVVRLTLRTERKVYILIYFTVLTITLDFSFNGQLFKTISTCNKNYLFYFTLRRCFWLFIVA